MSEHTQQQLHDKTVACIDVYFYAKHGIAWSNCSFPGFVIKYKNQQNHSTLSGDTGNILFKKTLVAWPCLTKTKNRMI